LTTSPVLLLFCDFKLWCACQRRGNVLQNHDAANDGLVYMAAPRSLSPQPGDREKVKTDSASPSNSGAEKKCGPHPRNQPDPALLHRAGCVGGALTERAAEVVVEGAKLDTPHHRHPRESTLVEEIPNMGNISQTCGRPSEMKSNMIRTTNLTIIIILINNYCYQYNNHNHNHNHKGVSYVPARRVSVRSYDDPQRRRGDHRLFQLSRPQKIAAPVTGTTALSNGLSGVKKVEHRGGGTDEGVCDVCVFLCCV
jgi:hypothetical protein